MFYTVHMKTKADLFTRPYALRISDEDHARLLREKIERLENIINYIKDEN